MNRRRDGVGHLGLVLGATAALAVLASSRPGWAQGVAAPEAPAVAPAAAPAIAPAQAPPAAASPAEDDGALRERLARQERQLAEQQEQLRALQQDVDSRHALEAASAVDSSETEQKLRFYGFMDFGLQKAWFSQRSGLNEVIESKSTTFVLGNVNLYLDARPSEQWRALSEVRFTTYPHGDFSIGQPGQGFQRTDTTIFDVNSASGGFAPARWGAIVLERAQLEWSGADWLNVRGGYWFTPYGIWNVDHGTPTLISLNVPQFVVFEAFPARQLGLDLYGTFHPGTWNVDYHAYISNGRTPGQLDPTEDKMLGGRVALSRTQPFALALGASGFYGRYSDKRARVVSYVPTLYARDEVVAYDEAGAGGDLAIDAGKLRVRSEFALNRRVYDQGKQEPGWAPGTFFPSRVFWGAYALVAYDIGFAGFEPYVYGELDRNMLPTSQAILTPSVGLNVHFTPAAQLKLQYSHSKEFDVDDLGRDHSGQGLDFLASRLVVAF